MKKRTIKSLMSPKKTVYVFIHSEWVAQAFFALAKYEGFTLTESLREREPVKERLIVRLNCDLSLTKIQPHSWAGTMAYHHILHCNPQKNELFVDFETMLYS